MSDRVGDRLMSLKSEIEAAKTDEAEAQGALKQSLKALKEDFGLNGIEAGEDRLDALDAEIQRLETDIEGRLTELEDDYEW